MAKNTPPVSTPTASSTNPTKPTAVSLNPETVNTILDILGNLPNNDFFNILSDILLNTDSDLDRNTYTEIIETLENAKITDLKDDILTPSLFNILEGHVNLPFVDDDDSFYLAVAKTLQSLIGKAQYPRLREAILGYIIDINDNDDQNDLLMIAKNI